MRFPALLLQAFCIVALGTSVPGVLADHPHTALEPPDLGNGEALYNTTCVACHGPGGQGLIPGTPDFRKKDSGLVTKDLDTLLHNVDVGFQSPGSMLAMPPKGGNASLSEQDLVDVLHYMRDAFQK
jgi:cytochrome c5